MDVIISSDLNYVAYLNFRSKQIHFPFLARWWERERKCQRKAQTITLFCFVLFQVTDAENMKLEINR